MRLAIVNLRERGTEPSFNVERTDPKERGHFCASGCSAYQRMSLNLDSAVPARKRALGGLGQFRISAFLLGLVLAAVLPAITIGIVATWLAVAGQRAAAEGLLTDTAQALTLAIDQDLAALIAALQALAASPAFDPGRPSPPEMQTLYDHARRVAAEIGAPISISGPDGTRLLNSAYPFGQSLPRIADLDLFARVLATRVPAIGNLRAGSMTHRLNAHVAVPVIARDGSVAMIVSSPIEPERIQKLLRAAAVPVGGVAAVADGANAEVARSDDLSEVRVGRQIAASAITAMDARSQGFFRIVSSDNIERVYAFHKLNVAGGWALAVAQTAEAFDAGWQKPLNVIVIGTCGALLLGIIFSMFAARQILVPVRKLSAIAEGIARPDQPADSYVSGETLPSLRVKELETLRYGFAAAEDRLRRKERELRELFEASPVGIARCTFNGRILQANDRVLEILGMTRADLEAGRVSWEERTPPDSKGITEAAIAQALESPDGRAIPYEKVFARPDGRRVPVLNSFSILDRKTGEVAVFVMDLTAVKQQEERLRLFLDRAPAGIAMFDRNMRYIAVSRRYLEDYSPTGLTPQTIIGRNHYEVFPEIPERWRDVHRRILAGETLTSEDDPFIRQDGRTDWVRWEMTPWYAPDGSVGGAVLFSQAVTLRKQAEMALAEREARLRGLLETMREGIVVASEDGTVAAVNPAAVRMFGYEHEDDLLGQPIGSLMPAIETARHNGSLTTTFGPMADSAGCELSGRRKDGSEFPAEVTMTRFRSGDEDLVTAVIRDVSERKYAEAAERQAVELERLVEARTLDLERAQLQLGHAAKMEALGRLAGGMAHDFNNVLQAVNGSVALAVAQMQKNPKKAESSLSIALAAVERGAAVTGRLLTFARRGELTAMPVVPSEMLEEVAEMLRYAFGPGVELTVEVVPGTPRLYADVGQLESVLVNLASNARDALKGGSGVIRLSAGPVTPNEMPSQLPPGQYVRLSVIDNGSGMAPEVLARVSEPFFTTKSKGRGTGLGLAMARGFAEQSGGALTVESVLDEGTVASLWLPEAPVAQDIPHDVGEPGAVADAVRPSGVALLLVDDEPEVRATLAALLEERGHIVTEAEDGASALKMLDGGAVVDVLVTDLSMPGDIDGLGLVREARIRRPGLPAVLITGHAGEADDAAFGQASGSGPFAVIRKPFPAKALDARVHAILRG